MAPPPPAQPSRAGRRWRAPRAVAAAARRARGAGGAAASGNRRPGREGKTRAARPAPPPPPTPRTPPPAARVARCACACAAGARGDAGRPAPGRARGTPSRPARMRRRPAGGSPVAAGAGSRYPPVRMPRGRAGGPGPQARRVLWARRGGRRGTARSAREQAPDLPEEGRSRVGAERPAGRRGERPLGSLVRRRHVRQGLAVDRADSLAPADGMRLWNICTVSWLFPRGRSAGGLQRTKINSIVTRSNVCKVPDPGSVAWQINAGCF